MNENEELPNFDYNLHHTSGLADFDSFSSGIEQPTASWMTWLNQQHPPFSPANLFPITRPLKEEWYHKKKWYSYQCMYLNYYFENSLWISYVSYSSLWLLPLTPSLLRDPPSPPSFLALHKVLAYLTCKPMYWWRTWDDKLTKKNKK